MIVVKDSSPVACWRGAGSKASTRRRWQARNVGEAPPLCHGKRARMATAVRILDYAVTFEFTDRPPLTPRHGCRLPRDNSCLAGAAKRQGGSAPCPLVVGRRAPHWRLGQRRAGMRRSASITLEPVQLKLDLEITSGRSPVVVSRGGPVMARPNRRRSGSTRTALTPRRRERVRAESKDPS